MFKNEKNIKKEIEIEDSLISSESEKQNIQSNSIYIIKYTRKNKELYQSINDTHPVKAKHCLFMLDLNIIKNNDKNKKNESLLHIKFHEMAEIHFEDYYERVYTYKDIIKENKYFKALDNIENIKEIIDYVLRQNLKNSQKIWIQIENNILKLHIMLTYFDKIKEVVLNIPRKVLNEYEKKNLLPMVLKEMQHKMKFYEKENKKYKNEEKKVDDEKGNTNMNFYEYYLKIRNEKKKEKKKEEEINKIWQESIVNETYKCE